MPVKKRKIRLIKSEDAKKTQVSKPFLVFVIIVCILSVLFSVFMLIRAREMNEPASAASDVPVSAPPEIFSASITPDKPTGEPPLIVRYSASNTEGDGVNLVFRWHVDTGIAQEGPSDTLDPGWFKKGANVYVEIMPSDSRGAGKTFKTEPVTIGNLPPVVSSISLKPIDPPVGAVLTATPMGTDPDGDDIAYTYQWGVNERNLSGQNADTFNTAGLKKRDMVYVVATPSDGTETGKALMSDVIVLANSTPGITSLPQYELANNVYQYQVTATDPDGDALSYSLLTSPAGMTIDRATGVIRWEVPKEVEKKQDVPIKISVDDGDGGSAVQEFSLTLEP